MTLIYNVTVILFFSFCFLCFFFFYYYSILDTKNHLRDPKLLMTLYQTPHIRTGNKQRFCYTGSLGFQSTIIYPFCLCLQVGVNILMAQVGSFVPCDKANISVRDCIFARVGAGDCQVSTIAYSVSLLTI